MWNSIVIGDKTWVYHFLPETKRQSLLSGDIPIHQRNASSSRQLARKIMAMVFWRRKNFFRETNGAIKSYPKRLS